MSRKPKADSAKKRPRQAVQTRSRHTVETILEAATRILASEGWPGLNTNAVARIAGVSIGSVYEYFGNKEAILEVILDRHLASGEAQLKALAGIERDALTLDEIVALLVGGFVATHRDDPKLHRVLSEQVPLSEAQRQRVQDIRDRAIALLAEILRERVSRPELKATLMIDAADALTHKWFVDEDGIPADPEELTGELQRMLRSYLHECGGTA
jgi:AcrR family transcriptional regulator